MTKMTESCAVDTLDNACMLLIWHTSWQHSVLCDAWRTQKFDFMTRGMHDDVDVGCRCALGFSHSRDYIECRYLGGYR